METEHKEQIKIVKSAPLILKDGADSSSAVVMYLASRQTSRLGKSNRMPILVRD
jgi:hypothetical protein